MIKIPLILPILFSISSLMAAEQPATTADDVARRAGDIAGGGGAWEKARYISFTFNVLNEGKVASSFAERLDRVTGDYRVSGKRADGVPFEAVINIASKKIRGTLSGKKVTERDQVQALYDLAFRRFINDMNWLLMPLEMFTPGAHRSYAGERVDSCGHTWDLVGLTFDEILGFAPGESYWLWVNRDTGLVDEWDIKTAAPDEPPLQVLLQDYRRVGGLLVSARRELKGKKQTIQFDDLQILPEVPKGAFQ